MKNTYIIREVQNAASHRDGEVVHSKSLAHAKKMALRRQSFQGTVMKIEDIYGNVLAVKEGGRWRDTNAA
jgi:hypothetical protein